MNRLKNIMIIIVCIIVIIATVTWKLTKKEKEHIKKSDIVSGMTTEREEIEPYDYVDSVVQIENGQEKNYFDVYPYVLRSLPSLLQAKLERNVSGVSAWIDWDSIEDTQENIEFCVDCVDVKNEDQEIRLKVMVDKEKEDIEILEQDSKQKS